MNFNIMSNLQTNETVKHYLAEAIIGEVESPNFLITITRAECSPDFSVANIFVSILPENFSGTALKNLRKKSSLLSKVLKNKLKLIKGPYLNWEIDEDLKRAIKIEETLEEIKKEQE